MIEEISDIGTHVHACSEIDFPETVEGNNFNPNQFAYKSNRSHDDVITIVNHEMRLHLESKDSYVRILFIDLKAAFTTLIPSILRLKC